MSAIERESLERVRVKSTEKRKHFIYQQRAVLWVIIKRPGVSSQG